MPRMCSMPSALFGRYLHLLVTLGVTQAVDTVNLFIDKLIKGSRLQGRCLPTAASASELIFPGRSHAPAQCSAFSRESGPFHICYLLSTCYVLRPRAKPLPLRRRETWRQSRFSGLRWGIQSPAWAQTAFFVQLGFGQNVQATPSSWRGEPAWIFSDLTSEGVTMAVSPAVPHSPSVLPSFSSLKSGQTVEGREAAKSRKNFRNAQNAG